MIGTGTVEIGTIFYTADLHLGHENVIAYSNRPFSNAAEMLECIILVLFVTCLNNETFDQILHKMSATIFATI